MNVFISNNEEPQVKGNRMAQGGIVRSDEHRAERPKPKMAGNKSFRIHNKLRFSRTHARKVMGKNNRM